MLKRHHPILSCLSLLAVASSRYELPAKAEISGVRPDNTTSTQIEGSVNCIADCFISGGSRIGDSLFHSFERFSIAEDVAVTFGDADVVRIFARVSEGPTIINGTLAIAGTGQTDFFILNPYGIVFGSEAMLQNVGSFVATTAESFVFADDQHFGVVNINPPLLTVSIPVGLQFGSQSEPIVNQSRSNSSGAVNALAQPAGLQTNPEKVLALVGNGVFFEGGNLTVDGGQVSIASVGRHSRVSLSPELRLGYEDTFAFEDVELTQFSAVDVSGDEGSISVRGRNILASENSAFINQTASSSVSGVIDILADERVDLSSALVIFSPLLGSTSDSADLNISAKSLRLSEGALIFGGTFGVGGDGGTLTINASESVEVTGSRDFVPTLISTSTDVLGAGGSIVINTQSLVVADGGQIEAATYGPGQGGDININASADVEVRGKANTLFAVGSSSSIRASSGIEGTPLRATGRGGDLTINTGSLSVRDGAEVAVNSFGDGDSGNLRVNARSVLLADDAQLTAAATFGNGGNLILEDLETLVLRRGSNISTQAGIGAGLGDGGNLAIDADFVVAGLFEDSDIVAKASQGRGGNISIRTRGLYGLEERRAIANNGTNDIDASSDFGISGNAAVEQLTVEAELELADVEARPVETASVVSQRCGASGNRFVATGRGGIPAGPDSAVERTAALVDLGEGYMAAIAHESLTETHDYKNALPTSAKRATWVEASGWRLNDNGQVNLTALPDGSNEFSPTAAGNCAG